MKKLIILVIFGLMISANVLADNLDGLWNIRCNGTAIGYMDLNGNTGTFRTGGSAEDSIKITMLESTGSAGAKKIRLIRRGSYNQEYFGWLSSNQKQMAGYYIHNGQQFPWTAEK